jgi:hypothetical protein
MEFKSGGRKGKSTNSKSEVRAIGSRISVYNGLLITPAVITRRILKNKRGRIVSKKKHFSEKSKKLKGSSPSPSPTTPQEELDAQHQKDEEIQEVDIPND